MEKLQLAGIQVLKPTENNTADLGPLAQLVGTWTSSDNPQTGWNVIAVPGPNGFVLEIIPYKETITFSPVVVASNRGPFVNGNEEVQNIVGLLYEQSVISTCTLQKCTDRGFPAGSEIHAETGLFLYLTNENGGYDIARMSTIPHGNSVLALGNSSVKANPGTQFIPEISSLPFPNPGVFGYSEEYTLQTDFPNFDAANPNKSLFEALGSETIKTMTTLDFSTTNGTGGILNIPFIQQNINTTRMDSTFWIEELSDGTMQLQYSQNIFLDFPPTGSKVMVTWPHVTVNTLTKQS